MDDVTNGATASLRISEATLASRIVDQAEEVVREAEAASRPLEIEPYRGRLFELFVTAEGAGYLTAEALEDLTADGLCRQLSERWGLKQAAEQSFAEQSNLPTTQLQKMRSLWSLMRMWMEWTYAWDRWEEFHRESSQ